MGAKVPQPAPNRPPKGAQELGYNGPAARARPGDSTKGNSGNAPASKPAPPPPPPKKSE